MSEYVKAAKDFMKKHNAKISISFIGCKRYFSNDNEARNVYKVRIDRNHKTMTFTFGDSLQNTWNHERPNVYDILACIEKYNPGSFEDFCNEFGYEMYADCYEFGTKEGYNRDAYRTYNAVKRQYARCMRVFGDCIEELREIQ